VFVTNGSRPPPGYLVRSARKEHPMTIDDMKPEMTPGEEDAAADAYRERLKRLGELKPPTDPGEIRERNREKEELERRIREHNERRLKRESDAKNNDN
jgi:hypothetical protein